MSKSVTPLMKIVSRLVSSSCQTSPNCLLLHLKLTPENEWGKRKMLLNSVCLCVSGEDVWGGGCSLGLRTARESSDSIDWKKAKFYSYFALVLP